MISALCCITVQKTHSRWLSLFHALDRLAHAPPDTRSAGCRWKSIFTHVETARHTYEISWIRIRRIRSCACGSATETELYMYFVHFFTASFQETVLKLEGKCATASDLSDIMDRFRQLPINKADDSFFGMKVKMAIRKNYLSASSSEVHAWSVDSVQTDYTPKSGLSLTSHHTAIVIHSTSKPPKLDDILQIWMQTPLKENAPPDSI